MYKKVTAWVMCVVTALCLVALPGCNSGESAADVITEGLSAELDQLVNQKGDDWDAMIASIEESQGTELATYGITAEDFTKALLGGFNYEITDVDVDEDSDTAVAHVTLTCKSLTDFNDKLTEAASNLMSDESITSLSQDELNTKIGETVLQVLNELKTKETELDLQINRDEDGVWSEDESVATEVANAMLG